jgi:hypothetical protein
VAADERHRELLDLALAHEGMGHRALLAGDVEQATPKLESAARHYRESWETAPPRSYGRMVGMLKAAVLAGDAEEEARYARTQIGDDDADSPASWYVLAIAALVEGDDALAEHAAAGMEEGSEPFVRAARAVRALARTDRQEYAAAVGAIVADFESRDDHLTGVAIADTALMFERLADRRGLAAAPQSELLPPP